MRVAVDEKRDTYDTTIWLARTDGSAPARPLTSGIRDTTPRWSPDGSRLAFVRAVETRRPGQPPQIHLLSMAGGEAWALTEMPRGAAAPEWAPDGSAIAFSSAARPEDLTPAKPGSDRPRESDVRVITDAAYRANGVAGFGFVDRDRPARIWTVAVPAGTERPAPVAVTGGDFAASGHRWSPDGSRIFFTADRRKEAYYYARDSDLFSVAKTGGDPVVAASIDGSIGAYAIAGDGRDRVRRYSHGQPERSYSQPDLWIVDRAGGSPRNLTERYDFDVAGGLSGDSRAPRGQLPPGRYGAATAPASSSAPARMAAPTSSASTSQAARSTLSPTARRT